MPGAQEPGFHDYTIASPVERFVAVLESALKAWDDTGLKAIVQKGTSHRQQELPSLVKVQVALKHRLKWRREPYLLSLQLPAYVMLEDSPALTAPGTTVPAPEQAGAPTAAPGHAAPLCQAAATSPEELQGGRRPSAGTMRPDLQGESACPGQADAVPGQESGPEDDGEGWEVGVTLDPMDVQRMLQDMDDIMEQDSEPEQAPQSENGALAEGTDVQGTTATQEPGQAPAGVQALFPSPARAIPLQAMLSASVSSASLAAQPARAYLPRPCTYNAAAPVPPMPLPWWPLRPTYRPWWRYTHQHKLQHWFGLDDFLLLQPHSFSKRFLDEHEARSVLASAACALANCGLSWPVLIPVHDALRDAYLGLVCLPPSPACPGGTTVRLLADCVHLSRMADPLLTPRGQVRAFADQLSATAPAAADLCRSYLDPSHTTTTAAGGRLSITARYTWRLPHPLAFRTHSTAGKQGLRTSSGGASSCGSGAWDEGAAWAPWAQHADPVTCIELDTIWQEVDLTIHTESSSSQHSSELAVDSAVGSPLVCWPQLQPSRAHHWVVHVLQRGLSDDVGAVLGLLVAEKQRQHVKLGEPTHSQESSSRSFHSMLSALSRLRHLIGGAATSMGELAGDSWWWDRSHVPGSASALPPAPSEAALAAILVDVWEGMPLGTDTYMATHTTGACALLTYPRTAALDSPLMRLALHCLMCGNPRAVALLWARFLRSLRLEWWETGARMPLASSSWDEQPGVPAGTGDGPPDLQCCLLQQKLQVLDVCIARSQAQASSGAGGARVRSQAFPDVEPSQEENIASASEVDDSFFSADEDEEVLAGQAPRERVPRGVEGVLDHLALTRHPDRPLRVPLLQARPVLSEDRRHERVALLLSLRRMEGAGGDSSAGGLASSGGHVDEDALLAAEVLVSDMAAFKAANPGAVLQDFVAWQQLAGQRLAPLSLAGSPAAPASWALLWDTTAPCPAASQKPLQDPLVEGERVLHDLDTLDMADVIDTLLALGLAAAVALLAGSQGASLPPVQHLCMRFHRLSSGLVRSSGMPSSGGAGQAPRTSLSGPAVGRRLVGFQEHAFEFLLDELQYLEAVVVLGESLCRRLPGCDEVASSLIDAATQGRPTVIIPTYTAPTTSAAASAPPPQQVVLREHICSADVQSNESRRAVSQLLLPHMDSPGVIGPEGSTEGTAGSVGAEQNAAQQWPPAAHYEWGITAGLAQEEAEPLGKQSMGSCQAQGEGRQAWGCVPDSRMFVCHSGGQTRCCFTLVSE